MATTCDTGRQIVDKRVTREEYARALIIKLGATKETYRIKCKILL